ncbi:DUF4270 family protein [Chitinophaga flava]|uniref:DUF4270 domain-containing protein n=1 Tax=Chitinophaga flava TaxID=2259036 RepID=A0A365XNW7_9BACT|nr:DUF4270 family protein [Chitinophaga flava]RBL88026.1 hypothetical protein DF182_31310 [Chitinophaga flava]
MKINFRNLSFVAASFALLYGASGCNESTILGQGLIPPGDFVNAQDTTINGIIANNILRYDSSLINGFNRYTKALGSITTDPVFGKTHAFVFMQVGLPTSAFTFAGTGQTLDSVVLSLDYLGSKGDSSTSQTFRVYRMAEQGFTRDSNYAYNKPLAYNPGELLGTATITPLALRDSVSVYGTKEAPQLRIKLSNSFGNDLLQQKSDGAFANDSSFRAYLKGFALVPDTTSGTNRNMMFFDMNNANTKLTVFYKNSTQDSLRATFAFNGSSSAHSNFIVRNYNGSEAGRFINTGNANGDSILFLQSTPGLFTNLLIPNLENFPNAVINKAELVITQITVGSSDMNNIFAEPTNLSLVQYTGSGDSIKNVIDFAMGAQYFGGDKKTITNFGGVQVSQYTFNIGRFMQMLIKKQESNTGFKLRVVPTTFADVDRLKAGGTKLSQYNIKLRIIYTKP